MSDTPYITAEITFLKPEEGGRSRSAFDQPLYRPHVVVGDPTQRVAIVDDQGVSQEDYLGVQFTGDGEELISGKPHVVFLKLVYHPKVDYSALHKGVTFTIREGGHIVGFGHVINLLPNKPPQRSAKRRR